MSPSGARGRITRFIEAAREVWGPGRTAENLDRLVEETGLSRQGVTHALDHVLELRPAPGELDHLLARAPSRSAVVVVLSANVFTAPLRAIAWALAQSSQVTVRCSRRARAFLEPLGEAIPLVTIVSSDEDPSSQVDALLGSLPAGGALHLYAGSATIDRVAPRVPPQVHAELHGPGFGAILARDAAIVASADAVARDVATFDQRGCLSPRVMLVEGDAARAAHAVHQALGELDRSMPRGRLSPEERGEIARAVDAARYAGRALVGEGHALLLHDDANGLPLGPVGRTLVVLPIAHVDRALELLAPHAAQLTTIGTDRSGRDQAFSPLPRCRIVALGAMQLPPLDGPVDLRV